MEGMAQFTEEHDRGKLGGGDGINRGEGTDSQEGGGKYWRQSPEVQRDGSRRGTENLNTDRNSGIGTRWRCKKLGWWGALSGVSTGVLRDPVVYPESVREWRLEPGCWGVGLGAEAWPQDRWWSWSMGGGVE